MSKRKPPEKKAKSAPSEATMKANRKITKSSTAEYFSKNLQQVGFSSPTKAVLTTLKEAVDNSLDACEDAGILPNLIIKVEKLGAGTLKNTDQIRIEVEDNGPGIDPEDAPKVFGEYLASSKFGRGRCSRGQQGIGISAATTWAQQTTATGAKVTTKTKGMRKAQYFFIDVDLKNNKGRVRERQTVEWDKPHGTKVSFLIDGRIQLNGEAGLYSFLNGNILVNPHMTLTYHLPDEAPVTIERVSDDVPTAPKPVQPHPQTMQLGDFLQHASIFGGDMVGNWLKKGFSRINEGTIAELIKEHKVEKKLFEKRLNSLSESELKSIYGGLQNAKLMAPSTQSVLSIGEKALAKSIRRLGQIDFISVHTRKPTICDYKPMQVEVAIARLAGKATDSDEPVTVLRFANRVPLQFDKASCAIVKALQTVNWRTYGLKQPKGSIPCGPFIVAVSVVSPFIKFKNASKETIDASDELVEELRRGMINAGQKLSKHLRREIKARELGEKISHIEQFAPILVEILCRITKATKIRKEKAEQGLLKILEKDTKLAKSQLADAATRLEQYIGDDLDGIKGLFEGQEDRYGEQGELIPEDGIIEGIADDDSSLEVVDIESEAPKKSGKKKKGQKSSQAPKKGPKKASEPAKVAEKSKKTEKNLKPAPEKIKPKAKPKSKPKDKPKASKTKKKGAK